MDSFETNEDPKRVPFLKCRGSHYEVGFKIGQTFKTMIQELLNDWKYFETLQKIGSTPSAKAITENSLRLCKSKFPGYVDEIRGMADGAEIDFEKLFLLNIDSMLSTETTKQELAKEAEKAGGAGCTSILCNKDEVILGHTEDAMAEIKDHVYIIAAEILSVDGKVLEKFTTLCYAGTLMGYTMGYNDHGMVYSVNTIFANVCTSGSPRAFIARALLAAQDLPSLLDILKDKGNGVADGFSLNVYFYPKLNYASADTGAKAIVLYNIEIAPTKNFQNGNESIVDIHEVHPGSTYTHCNRYLRIDSREWNQTAVKFSDRRHTAICRHREPCCEDNVKCMLSDQTDLDYPVYNDGKCKTGEEQCAMSFIRTVAVGTFNIKQKTWNVFAGPPACNNPEYVFNI